MATRLIVVSISNTSANTTAINFSEINDQLIDDDLLITNITMVEPSESVNVTKLIVEARTKISPAEDGLIRILEGFTLSANMENSLPLNNNDYSYIFYSVASQSKASSVPNGVFVAVLQNNPPA